MEEFFSQLLKTATGLVWVRVELPIPGRMQAGTWWGVKLRLGCWGITLQLTVGSYLTQSKIMA